jgi:archaellum component FlaD/FlaE
MDSKETINPTSIDTSLIEHFLSLSYEERLNAHEIARQLVNDLQHAGQEYYARRSKSPT